MTLLIFDCDGVLVDSESIALASLVDMLAALGWPTDVAECRDLFMGKSLKDVLAKIESLIGRPLPPDFGARANADLLARFHRELRPVEGVREAIEQLSCSCCVASSSQLERIMLSLAVTGLAPLFEGRVFSATEVANGKPAPDLFLHAAQCCGFRPADCLVIEDSPAGIVAAGRARMASIGFAGASHADRGLAEALAAAGANIVIGEMAALPMAVERLRAADGNVQQRKARLGQGPMS